MRRNEYISLEDITLMVEKGKYSGEFEIKIMETSEWFDVDAWVILGDGLVDCDFELPSSIDMVEHDEFAHMCVSAILEEYPEHIRGFNKYVNENGFDSYEEAIEELKSINCGSFVDTYTKYNNRVAANIKASGDAGRLIYEGISRRCRGRRINESAMKYGKNYILNEMSGRRGMRISEMISMLEELQDYCGDVKVRVVSDDYHLTVHNIVDIRESSNYNHDVEIVIG